MKKTRNLLAAVMGAFLLVSALIYICGDFLLLDMAVLTESSRQTQFVCSTAMILLTVSLLPLSLRLFRFERIHHDLIVNKEKALARWGTVRLVCLGTLLVVNTGLHYAFVEAAYGYLAVVTLLCLPFVTPTMSRCMAETTDDDKEKSQMQNETDEEANDSNSKL